MNWSGTSADNRRGVDLGHLSTTWVRKQIKKGGEEVGSHSFSAGHQLQAEEHRASSRRPHNSGGDESSLHVDLRRHLRCEKPTLPSFQRVGSHAMINDCTQSHAARTHGWIDYSFLNKLCKTCTFHTARVSIFEFPFSLKTARVHLAAARFWILAQNSLTH